MCPSTLGCWSPGAIIVEQVGKIIIEPHGRGGRNGRRHAVGSRSRFAGNLWNALQKLCEAARERSPRCRRWRRGRPCRNRRGGAGRDRGCSRGCDWRRGAYRGLLRARGRLSGWTGHWCRPGAGIGNRPGASWIVRNDFADRRKDLLHARFASFFRFVHRPPRRPAPVEASTHDAGSSQSATVVQRRRAGFNVFAAIIPSRIAQTSEDVDRTPEVASPPRLARIVGVPVTAFQHAGRGCCAQRALFIQKDFFRNTHLLRRNQMTP